jgi:hypothetical protein
MATSTTTTHHEEEDDDALPPTVAAVVEPAKLKLLEARFGADPDNSNSQKSFDSPSLQYRTNVPSWQRMQTPTTAPPPNKSSLKSNTRKQAHPQRKSVVIVVQESPPTTKGKGGNSNGSASVRIFNYVDLSESILDNLPASSLTCLLFSGFLDRCFRTLRPSITTTDANENPVRRPLLRQRLPPSPRRGRPWW